MLRIIKAFWNHNFVQDAPAELSQCEFGCRATNCQAGQWRRCKNRLLALEREALDAKSFGAVGGGQSPARD